MTDDEAAHFAASVGAPISSDAPKAGEQAAARLGGLLNRWHAFASEGYFAVSAAPGQPASRAGTPAQPDHTSSRGRSQSRHRGRPAAAATAQGRRSPHSPPPASAAADDGFGSGSDVDAASEDGVAATTSGGTPSYRFKYGPAESHRRGGRRVSRDGRGSAGPRAPRPLPVKPPHPRGDGARQSHPLVGARVPPAGRNGPGRVNRFILKVVRFDDNPVADSRVFRPDDPPSAVLNPPPLPAPPAPMPHAPHTTATPPCPPPASPPPDPPRSHASPQSTDSTHRKLRRPPASPPALLGALMVASVACSCFPPPDPTGAPRGPSPVPPCARPADDGGEAARLPRASAHADKLAAQIALASAEAATAMEKKP